MFVQVIEAKTSDPAFVEERMNVWLDELRPGAIGFLGSTGGVTADGKVILLARFESAEAAQANSDRPEQGEWWAATESGFDGGVEFSNSEDIDLVMGGGSNEAGFVQVMKVSNAERDQVEAMDRLFERHAADIRPDVIGGMRVWTGPDKCFDVTYFTSEAEAREGESRELPPDLMEKVEALGGMPTDVEYFDLTQPLII